MDEIDEGSKQMAVREGPIPSSGRKRAVDDDDDDNIRNDRCK